MVGDEHHGTTYLWKQTGMPPEVKEEPEIIIPEIEGFVCEYCGRSFEAKRGLTTHLRFCKKK